MTLHHPRPASSLFSISAKSIVSIVLSFACVFTLGVDLPLPAAAATPIPGKDKKAKQDPALKGLPITELSADEAILHALNRLAYGPRPGDLERVRQMGLAKWIDQQLNPNSIDDRAVEARLEAYPTLRMSSAALLAEYPQPKQAEKQAVNAQAAPLTRSDAAASIVARDMQPSSGRVPAAAQRPVSVQSQTPPQGPAQGQGQPQAILAGDSASPGGQPRTMQVAAKAPDTVSPMKLDDSQANVATPGAGGKRDALTVDPNAVPRAIADDSKKPQRVVEELAMAKVTRAIYSERQLQQILDDFWFNHFNVFAAKGDD